MIAHSRVVAAQRRFPRSAAALDYWYRLIKRGRYRNFAELRDTFGAVDKVGPLMVFNVGGNRLRLIAAVHFNTGKVFVRHILSHTEYDAGTWKRKTQLQ